MVPADVFVRVAILIGQSPLKETQYRIASARQATSQEQRIRHNYSLAKSRTEE